MKISDLQNLSKKWDGKTVTIAVHIGGSGNMFGGNGLMKIVTVHGDNSIYNGIVEVGEITYTYNIARGLNGPDSSRAVAVFSGFYLGHGPGQKVILSIDGVGSADEALCASLNLRQDWLIKKTEIFPVVFS